MRSSFPIHNSATLASTGENLDFTVPSWAVGATFFFKLVVAGTAPSFALKFQYADPLSNTFVDVAGGSIVTLTANGQGLITIDPRITGAANVAIAKPLSASMRAVITTDRGDADETYTYTIYAEFSS